VRSQRFGDRTTRLRGRKPRASRKRRHAVGSHNEVLDDLLRPVLLVQRQIAKRIAVEDRAGLDRPEVQRALPPAGLVELTGDAVLHAGSAGPFRGPLTSPPASCRLRRATPPRRCRPLGLVADEGPIDLRVGNGPVGGDRHLDDDRRPILIDVER
jgi:hypothetical protein